MSDKYRRPNNPLVSEDLVWLLNTSLESFHTSIGTASVLKVREQLRKVLEKLGKATLAQLILTDKEGAITCALLSPPPLPDTEARSRISKVLRRLEMQLLKEPPKQFDTKTKQQLKKALSQRDKQLLQRAVDEGVVSSYQLLMMYGGVFACTYMRDRVVNGIRQRLYDIKPSRINSVLGGSMFEKSIGEYPLLTEIDIKELNLECWAKRIVVVANQWPPLGRLPAMSGLIFFSFKDEEKEEEQLVEQEQNLATPPRWGAAYWKNFEEQLREQGEELQLLSWVIFYTAFVFQTYALSQASAGEPRRLREELSREGWIEILKNAARRYSGQKEKNKELEELIEEVLSLENDFVTRRVFRQYSQYAEHEHPRVAKFLREKFVQLLNLNGTKSRDLLVSALRHLKALYPSIADKDVLTSYLAQDVWPIIRRMLLESPDETVCNLALSATEDIYQKADAGLQAEIGDSLVRLVENAIDQGVLNERPLATLILAIRYRKDKSGLETLVKTLCRGLLALPMIGELEIGDRLFALLDQDQREAILGSLSHEAHLTYDSIDQLSFIDGYVSGLEKEQTDKAGEIGSTELISVVSHKGGVGKTLVALGLASLLAEDHKVCLVELDFFGPTLAYLAGLDGSKERRVFLNEYIWANYIGKLTEVEREKAFRGRRFLERHFDELSRVDSKELLENTLWDALPQDILPLKIVPCSASSQLQDSILSFVVSPAGLSNMRNQLETLVIALHNMGYEYVIFDTPAELKEITMCATSLSLSYEGKNVFVATLFGPSIEPLLESLPLLYGRGENYLLINKVRELDRQYAEDKDALVDFLGTYRITPDVNAGYRVLSEAVLNMMLHVKYCGYVPWQEKLDKFLAAARPFAAEDYETLAASLREYLAPIVR